MERFFAWKYFIREAAIPSNRHHKKCMGRIELRYWSVTFLTTLSQRIQYHEHFILNIQRKLTAFFPIIYSFFVIFRHIIF